MNLKNIFSMILSEWNKKAKEKTPIHPNIIIHNKKIEATTKFDIFNLAKYIDM